MEACDRENFTCNILLLPSTLEGDSRTVKLLKSAKVLSDSTREQSSWEGHNTNRPIRAWNQKIFHMCSHKYPDRKHATTAHTPQRRYPSGFMLLYFCNSH